MGSCDFPSFSKHQREIITGLLMGDGSLCVYKNQNPCIQSNMISQNYLEYVDKQFGIFGRGVSLYMTAEESAKQDIDSGFNSNACEENYHDVYRWASMSHPELKEFAEWYSSGEKEWPTDIELTPTVLKHWYCGDGHWNNGGRNNAIEIAMFNEIENTKKVSKMFDCAGLPTPNNYRTSKTKCDAQFTVEQSEELWDYMGEPLPDFEYKWPEVYRKG